MRADLYAETRALVGTKCLFLFPFSSGAGGQEGKVPKWFWGLGSAY